MSTAVLAVHSWSRDAVNSLSECTALRDQGCQQADSRLVDSIHVHLYVNILQSSFKQVKICQGASIEIKLI